MKVDILKNTNGQEQIVGFINTNTKNEISSRKANRFFKKYGVNRKNVYSIDRNIKIIDKLGIIAFL